MSIGCNSTRNKFKTFILSGTLLSEYTVRYVIPGRPASGGYLSGTLHSKYTVRYVIPGRPASGGYLSGTLHSEYTVSYIIPGRPASGDYLSGTLHSEYTVSYNLGIVQSVIYSFVLYMKTSSRILYFSQMIDCMF